MDLYSTASYSNGQLILDELTFPVPNRISSKLHNGQQVTLGTRREDVQVSAEAMPIDVIQFEAEMEAVEPDFVHHVQVVYARMGKSVFSGLCSTNEELSVGQKSML